MGRNKGDPARSKGRPSSSSLAASLLQTPVATAVGFGGYVGSARVDTGPSPDGDLLMDVDGEASLHLRRLSKKDSTTKLKALTALTAIFKERPSAELSALLPSWVLEYKRLVQDSNRQVRESSHIAMTALVSSVGRGIAPHLRSLMGPWWVAQFDPSREVSEAAKSSFQMAFAGQKKRLEALIYCASEVFSHVDDNLKLTPQTISDKATPIEEATEKHERVVSCSLLALAAIIDVLVGSLKTGPGAVSSPIDVELAAKTRITVTEAATKLCWTHKYMREYVKSKSSRIRSAVYQALRAYIQHIPQVFTDDDMDSVAPSILGTFSEKDTACHQPMWDMVLLFSKGFPHAWGSSSVRKVVLPRLFGYLRHSCYGSELLSYSSLLPLLSIIPPKSVAPGQSFLIEFFSSFWRGRPAPQLGSAYWSAFLNAMRECFMWAVKNAKRFVVTEGSDVVELQVALIDGVLLRLLWCDYIGGASSQAAGVTPSPEVTNSQDVDSLELEQTQSSKAVESSGVEKLSSSSAVTSEDFVRDICSSIVDAIHSLSEWESKLLSTFWTEFQSICLDIVQEAGRRWQSERERDRRVSRIEDFLISLSSKTKKSGSRDRWVLTRAVKPFVSKAFPIIKSATSYGKYQSSEMMESQYVMPGQGNPESIRLLAKLTSVYGPTVFFGLIASATKDLEADSSEEDDSKDHRLMLQYFKEDIVPWCLDVDDELSGSKAELILAFIQSPGFQEEWDLVVAHIAGELDEMEKGVDLKAVGILAVLLEKVIEIGVTSRKERVGVQGKDVVLAWWKSSRIDKAALCVASSNYLSKPASFRLVRSVLGGMSSEDSVPHIWVDKAATQDETLSSSIQNVTFIVSDKTSREISQILLMRILSVLAASDTTWVKSAPFLFIDKQDSELQKISVHQDLTKEILGLATTAVDLVSECLLCLSSLDRDSTVFGKLVAALFCLRWGCTKLDDTFFDDEDFDSEVDSEEDEESEDGSPLVDGTTHLRLEGDVDGGPEASLDERSIELEQGWKLLMESVRNVQRKLSPSFCKSFSALTRFRVRRILIQCLRNAVLDEKFDSAQRVAIKVAAWTKEVVTFTCESAEEMLEALDLLLASGDYWPWWVQVPSSLQIKPERKLPTCKVPERLIATQEERHARFALFVDVLCKTLSPHEVFLGSSELRGADGKQDGPTSFRVEDASTQLSRTWLVVELLCTWQWPGGSASQSVLPFLCSLSRTNGTSNDSVLLWNAIETLFIGASQACSLNSAFDSPAFTVLEDDKKSTEEPFLRALLKLLSGLLEMEEGWSKRDTRELFRRFVTKQDAVNFVSPICDIRILPSVLSVLMPTLRRKAGSVEDIDDSVEEEWQLLVKNAVCEWLLLAMKATPLVASGEDSNDSGVKWIRVAVACFPLNSAGGIAAMASAFSMQVSAEEKAFLLHLLQKQFSREAIAAVAAAAAVSRKASQQETIEKQRRQVVEVTLAKLVAAAIAYCWLSFGVEEWEFVLSRLRTWMEEAVVDAEEFTETIVSVVEKESAEVVGPETQSEWIIRELENIVSEKEKVPVELSGTAVAVFSLLRGLEHLEGAESTDAKTHLQTANWKSMEMRALEDVLRLLLAIGLAESAAANSCAGEKAGKVIASWRKLQGQLWDSVADVAISASNQAREAAIRAVDLWGVGTGAINALYALLFSSQPTMSLQWVAYNFLTSGQVPEMAITCGVVNSGEGEVKAEEDLRDVSQEALTATVAQIRPELTGALGTSSSVLLVQPLTSPLRVRYVLGWSLFLTRLSSLPASSSTRERLVQYVQDSDTSTTLLDFLFQHIPLEHSVGGSVSRRRSLRAATKTSSAAAAATRAAATGSVAFAVEGLWPVQKESVVTLACAVYGLMLLVLPACVRIWFTGLRDKALASAIEAFTTTHCSPQLLVDEFAQVQASANRAQGAPVDEEEFSVRANRGLREVTAVYKKEEAGMDIVIRMPACYPLRAVGVECTRRMGIDETLLRKWILSMAAFLRNQNGAVSEAIQMWKRNVDREFEGVEPCPICYSIIHTSNHSLPRLACKFCRNKFHSACLYKWFSTSHQSTCPLCKTPF